MVKAIIIGVIMELELALEDVVALVMKFIVKESKVATFA